MSILENAFEIDRLYLVHDAAEQKARRAKAIEQKLNARVVRAEGIVEDASNRIEVMFDGMAASIPATVEEALGLAVLLRSQTDGSVFLEHDGEARERAERIIDNLVVGLGRLTKERLPAWFADHLQAAEVVVRGLDDESADPPTVSDSCSPADVDLGQPRADENGQPSRH